MKLLVGHAVTRLEGIGIPYEVIKKPLLYFERTFMTGKTRVKQASIAKNQKKKFFANKPLVFEQYLYDEIDNSFPTGMLNKVVGALRAANFDFEVVDLRKDLPSDDIVFGQKTGKYTSINPYPYQEDAIDNIIFKKRGLVQIACGGGKTLVASQSIRNIGKRTVFLVNRKGLLYQAKEVFEQVLGKEIGQIGDGVVDVKEVNIVMIQSLVRFLGKKYEKFDEEDIVTDDTDVEKFENARQIRDMLDGTEVVFMDECHCIGAKTAFDCLEAFKNASHRIGLSVGGDSMVTLKDINNEIKFMSIKELACKFGVGMDKIVDVKENLQVRAYNGEKFVWRKLNAIHKYKCDKKVFEITTDYGRKLRVTEDHSVFQVVEDGYYWKNNGKKFYGKLVEAKGDELQVGDCLLLEDKLDSGFIKEIDVLSVIGEGKLYVAGADESFREWIDANVDTPRARWRYKNGVHGCYLPVEIFNKSGLSGNKIYTEGAKGHWVSPVIPCSAIAYMVGYYIGDGWGGDRLVFAVPEQNEKEFLDKIKGLFDYADVKVSVRQTRGKSVEIHLMNGVLAKIFGCMFPNQRAHNKRIPVEVFNWCRESQELFLQGMIDSDGNIAKRARNRIRTYYTTISEKLSWDLCEFLKIFGIVASTSRYESRLGGVIEGRQIKGKHDIFRVHWSHWSQVGNNEGHYGRGSTVDLRGAEGQVVRIKDIKEVQESEVFDLTVDGTENFVANGILVHNSATPKREDGKDIFFEACFGERLANVSFTFLIENGFLIRPYIYIVPMPYRILAEGTSSKYQTIYKKCIVENELRNRMAMMYTRMLSAKGYHPLLMVQQVKHGKILEKGLTEAEFIYGKHSAKKRKQVLSDFCAGDISSLIATTILDEAIDIPQCDAVVMGGGGASYVRTIQRISRAMRVDRDNPNKQKSIIIDFQDWDKHVGRHSQIRQATYMSEKAFVLLYHGKDKCPF